MIDIQHIQVLGVQQVEKNKIFIWSNTKLYVFFLCVHLKLKYMKVQHVSWNP